MVGGEKDTETASPRVGKRTKETERAEEGCRGEREEGVGLEKWAGTTKETEFHARGHDL